MLEEVVQTDASSLPLSSDDRLNSIGRLAQAYCELNKLGQAVLLLQQVVDAAASDLSPNNPLRLYIMFDLADIHLQLDETDQAVTLLKEVIKLAEFTDRLVLIRELARAYTKLGTCEKIQEAVSLLEEVMDKGRETLHADPEELEITQERLADTQEQLRQISEAQLPVNPTEAQGIPDVRADNPIDSAVYRHLQDFTKRAALMF